VGTREVVDVHLITDELGGLGGNIFEGLQLVFRVEGVRRSTSRLELIDTGDSHLDILVSQVELWLIQLKVKHTGSSTSNVGSGVEVGSVDSGRGPYAGLSTYMKE